MTDTITGVPERDTWERALRSFLGVRADGADLPEPPRAVCAEVRRVRAKRNTRGHAEAPVSIPA